MRGHKFFRVLKFVAIGIVAFTAFGFVVTLLWNYLMPGLFGLRLITFWQAVGLMLLGRLLFGGFRLGRRREALARRNDATLGKNDTRGARKIPRRDARAVADNRALRRRSRINSTQLSSTGAT